MSNNTAALLLRDSKMPVNPFTDAYWKSEIEAYGLKKKLFHVEHVRVEWSTMSGRVDDYLNVNWRIDDGTEFPFLSIRDKLWMSLTPMELQSAALAIHRAHGVVVSGGLGLGYFAIRAAAKPEVTKVIVFEQEPLVIEWFKRAFKGRTELEKIEIVEGDIRKTFRGYTVDFCFMDIYPALLDEGTFTDPVLFRKHNQIGRYMFWGYERILVGLLYCKMLRNPRLFIGSDTFSYIKHWQSTPYTPGNPEHGTMDQYYRPQDIPPVDVLRDGKRVMRDYPL